MNPYGPEKVEDWKCERRRVRVYWTCSDYVHHAHRWWFTAWVCGKLQQYPIIEWLLALGMVTVVGFAFYAFGAVYLYK